MTLKVSKDGPWQKFYLPSRVKGVTGKEWQAALKRKKVADYKAAQSEWAFAKANVAAVRAELPFTQAKAKRALADIAAARAQAKAKKLKKAFGKAVAQAKKREKRAQIDLQRAEALP